jgi:hypothetical protein
VRVHVRYIKLKEEERRHEVCDVDIESLRERWVSSYAHIVSKIRYEYKYIYATRTSRVGAPTIIIEVMPSWRPSIWAY